MVAVGGPVNGPNESLGTVNAVREPQGVERGTKARITPGHR